MHRWLLALACVPCSCFGELPESVKVIGKPNPFSIEELYLLADGSATPPTVSVRGKAWNKGEEILYRIDFRARVTLSTGEVRAIAVKQLGMLDRHQLAT